MRISVIIPVYNAELFVVKAVESALQFKEVEEVILIEDGSKDKSLIICNELIAKYDRVKLFQHPNGENRGAGASRNVGLKNAQFEFVAFLDADDFYLPNRFLKDKIILEKNKDADGVWNAIGTHFYSEEAKNKYLQNKSEISTYTRPDINADNYFETIILQKGFSSLDGITIRKSSISKVGYMDESLRQSQDMDYILRLALHCKILPSSTVEPVTLRGVHENNRIHNISEAKRFGGLLYLKWLGIMLAHSWSGEVNAKIFYRAVVGLATNKQISRVSAALQLLLNYPSILSKVNLRDLVSGFRNKFK